MAARVQLPADVHQIGATGYIWTFLDEADDPDQIQVGQTIIAGDPDEPFAATVVDSWPAARGDASCISSSLPMGVRKHGKQPRPVEPRLPSQRSRQCRSPQAREEAQSQDRPLSAANAGLSIVAAGLRPSVDRQPPSQ